MLSKARLKHLEILKNKHTFYFNNHSKIFSLCLNVSLCHRKIFSLCLRIFPCVKAKFPVFSLSGKSKNQIPCFPCAVATLVAPQTETQIQDHSFIVYPYKLHGLRKSFNSHVDVMQHGHVLRIAIKRKQNRVFKLMSGCNFEYDFHTMKIPRLQWNNTEGC